MPRGAGFLLGVWDNSGCGRTTRLLPTWPHLKENVGHNRQQNLRPSRLLGATQTYGSFVSPSPQKGQIPTPALAQEPVDCAVPPGGHSSEILSDPGWSSSQPSARGGTKLGLERQANKSHLGRRNLNREIAATKLACGPVWETVLIKCWTGPSTYGRYQPWEGGPGLHKKGCWGWRDS